MADGPYVLTLDAGSSSVRAALCDVRGEVVPGTLTRIQTELERDEGGVAVANATGLRGALEQAIDHTLASDAARAMPIALVVMSTFWHSLVALDAAGEPLTPVLSWADTRSESDALALRAQLDGEAIHQRTGCYLHPSYLPAKLRWLRRNRPERFASAAAFVAFADACTRHWLGTRATSVSMASGSGLLDNRTCTWDEELLAALDLASERLPEIAPEPSLLPPVNAAFATRWPALAGVAWHAPIGDGAASNIGAGCATPDRIALMVGTSGALRRVEPYRADAPVVEGLWRYRVNRAHALPGGALSDGGSVYGWLLDTLQLPEPDALETLLAARVPGEHGLVVLPFFSGERSLGWVGDATAVFVGVRLHTDPLDLFHATLEAVAYRFAALVDRLSHGNETIVATGGGLRDSPAWLQMMADVTGRPIVASPVREASLRGAALLGLHAAGLIDDAALQELPHGGVHEPRWDHHAVHRELRAKQETLYAREIGPEGDNLLARQTR